MKIMFQQNRLPKVFLLLVFLVPIFFVGCNGNSIEEKSTVVASVTKIILPTSTQTQTITPTITPTHTPSPTNTLIPTPTSTPLGNAHGVLLGVCSWRICKEEKILFLDLNSGNFDQIGETGFRLQDISPDGKNILYSLYTDLFVMNFDGSGSYLISNDFDNTSELGAFWSLSDQIIFIKKLGNKEGVFKVNATGTEQVKIFEKDGILKLFKTMNDHGVFWIEGYSNAGGEYHRGNWWTSFEDGEQIKFFTPPANSIKPSLSGNYLMNILDRSTKFEIIDTEDSHSSKILGTYEVATEYLSNMSFSTDESKILVQEMICSPTCDQFSHYIISLNGELISQFPEKNEDLGYSGNWSPDDKLYIYIQRTINGNFIENILKILDLETYELKSITNDIFSNQMILRLLILPGSN